MFYITTLLVLVSCVAAKPVILLNYGGDESNHKFLNCSNPEAEYDPSNGYITYRCRPVMKEVVEEIFVDKKPLFDIKNLNFINEIDSDPLKEIFEETLIVDESFDDDDDDDEDQIIYEVVDIEAGKPLSQQIKSKDQWTFHLKDQDKKTKNECKLNCCPEGQMYQSELDICIDYQPGPPRPLASSSEQTNSESVESSPDKKPSAIYITDSQKEKPQADSPQAKPLINNQQSSSIASGTILSVGKFDLKNRCQDNEFYLSELDICVPLNK